VNKAVRLAGRISDWNDEKGFGFVEPNGGGARAFVHIKAFHRGARRPVAGDLIFYLPMADARGRLQALEVRHAGERVQPPRQPSKLPRTELGLVALGMIAAATAFGVLPVVLAASYAGMSALSFFVYWMDKSAAGEGARRIPENTLHLFDLLGGWPGALIAQQSFRHKTAKRSFQIVFWASVVANVGALAWLVYTGIYRAIQLWIAG
jgi:uncharacterized membrane protein YsdA (DUF1294 family)/cold shock CspA family protein